jgi:hypothetical protein
MKTITRYQLFLIIVISYSLLIIVPQNYHETTEVTITGVIEQIDDTTIKLNTGQDEIQIQMNPDVAPIVKNMFFHQGMKGSFYVTHHKKNDTYVLEGLSHRVFSVFSYREENSVDFSIKREIKFRGNI